MTAYASTFQRPVSFVNHLPRRLRFENGRTMPAVAPVRHILLIDSDPVFVYAFEREAHKYQIPLATLESNLQLRDMAKWPYDLVILDWESNGGEFAAEVASDIGVESGGTAVLLIGLHFPNSVQQRPWTDNVYGFSDKHQGADAVLSDALLAFARMKRRLPRRSGRGRSHLWEVPQGVAS